MYKIKSLTNVSCKQISSLNLTNQTLEINWMSLVAMATLTSKASFYSVLWPFQNLKKKKKKSLIPDHKNLRKCEGTLMLRYLVRSALENC